MESNIPIPAVLCISVLFSLLLSVAVYFSTESVLRAILAYASAGALSYLMITLFFSATEAENEKNSLYK